VEVVAKALSLDLPAVAEAHLELVERFLEEGKGLVDKDPCRPARSCTRRLRRL